jgi:hypothetical protein
MCSRCARKLEYCLPDAGDRRGRTWRSYIAYMVKSAAFV